MIIKAAANLSARAAKWSPPARCLVPPSVAYAADTAEPACEAIKPMNITAKHYYLDNVLLEAGFIFDGSVATSTRTELKTLEIKDGKIVALRDNISHADASLPHYDAGKKLMLPAMRDMHIHLDKTFYGGPWRSLNRPAGTTIQDMIRLEQKLLPELQPYTQERAEALIDLIQSKGSTIARSHCNIEPAFRPEKPGKSAGGVIAPPAWL